MFNEPARKIFSIIEVKNIGRSDGAEQQLFEYAYHAGVSLAILTDGREWSFFLPGEQGIKYGEKRVCKLDLVQGDVNDSARRLERYLLHSAVVSGQAIACARDDYESASRAKQIEDALPRVWRQMIDDEDGQLLEIIAARVETLCGFRPESASVANFIKASGAGRLGQASQARQALPTTSLSPTLASFPQLATDAIHSPKKHTNSASDTHSPFPGMIGFTFEGTFHRGRSAVDVLEQVYELLIHRDPEFCEKLSQADRGHRRRLVAEERAALYIASPNLIHNSKKLSNSWWMSTNYARWSMYQIIVLACEVANLRYNDDIVAYLGDSRS
ncbi:hypothetical protein [Rhodoblastus sp.]|uniref:hypothetical protein n=1 Tax=Rhodoblastus sp. TaxID=1962975 RepID=UPI003F99D646